ncbi:DUF3592 domain-containing protein [Micromonospora radicis]|nr:DUF3592 domain-containing protein [Micromonospora radicis]
MTGFVVLVAVAAMFVLSGAQSAYRTYRLDKYGAQAQATVREVHRLGRDSYVLVVFGTADGRDVVAAVTDYRWDPEPQVGDVTPVRYDPADPRHNVRDERAGGGYLDAVFDIVLGSVLGVGGGGLLWRSWSTWRENAEDWRTGHHFA